MFAGERRLSITEHSLMMRMAILSGDDINIFVIMMVILEVQYLWP